MTREGYLRLKYWSNDPFLNLVRAGFIFFVCGALYISLVNISMMVWTSFKLLLGAPAP
jgi:hypothetical protein